MGRPVKQAFFQVSPESLPYKQYCALEIVLKSGKK
jgi:hypothetical protein